MGDADVQADRSRNLGGNGSRGNNMNGVEDWVGRSKALKIQIRNFIDGRWKAEGSEAAPLEKFSPRDGQLLYRLGAGAAAEVNAAVSGAKRAFDDGRWSKLPL